MQNLSNWNIQPIYGQVKSNNKASVRGVEDESLETGIRNIINYIICSSYVSVMRRRVVNALEDNGGISGSVGVIVGILMLAGGIVSIATRNKTGKGHDIALIVLFGLAAVFGFAGYGNYSDLVIWSVWCLINAVLAVVSMIKNR